MGLLRTIIIIILVYYIIKFVMRLLGPLMARKIMEKAAENFENQFNNPYYKKSNVKEGETFIEKKPEEDTHLTDDNEGEFVDYEEVD